MEDRFRFRVWEKDLKIMKECTQITLDKDQTGSMCDVKEKVTAHLVYQPHYILMQCTGLKDDNGKLIYEGDILKYAEFDWNDFSFKDWETNQAVVVWGGKYDYPAFDLKDTDFDGTNGLAYLFGAGWHFEVVGNIYENPEQLSSK